MIEAVKLIIAVDRAKRDFIMSKSVLLLSSFLDYIITYIVRNIKRFLQKNVGTIAGKIA